MKKVFLLVAGCLLLVTGTYGQSVTQRLQKAFAVFEKDEQLKHAISSLYVIDGATGRVVFNKNSQIGLAPASTQKIITSVTAFELLGKDYRYKTEFGLINPIYGNNVTADGLVVIGSGDPTFGSWRFDNTKADTLLRNIKNLLIGKNVTNIADLHVFADDSRWGRQVLPGGWIWDDIGNYYGAGVSSLNWRENQYDIFLNSGKSEGDTCSIVKTYPELLYYTNKMFCEVVTGKPGSGDNAYVYQPPYSVYGFMRGTIPPFEKEFKISASISEPASQFAIELGRYFFRFRHSEMRQFYSATSSAYKFRKYLQGDTDSIYTHYSPSLDSIIYWFNKKSINLYGEALIKTFAYEKQGFGSTDSGVAIVKKFWKEKGLDEDELNICDGSGLSPLNRVTTHAQVEILKYAKSKDWFPYFYKSLPEYNGMAMKSGTISDVKGFCGYHKAKNGKEYIFSFLVNNYSGKSSALVGKMYKVLDELK
ncbi:MAG: D-alanyl-D-alanine carboxypeptidase/D-alanyl-D-alanine-endopeptidase [Chitinophagaceae bacterium]|nr:D-alanyl-D-alanine carboxypeptidase/D-alanyl-D-alanine-endopeptidase [Chitinophagaceae bacterium]